MRGRWLWVTAGIWLAATSGTWADGIEIGGRVLTAEGAPLPKAEVRLLPLADPLSELRAALDGERAEPAARARTDTDGRFRLEAPGAGLWRVRVDAPGFVPAVAELSPLIEPVELAQATLSPDAGLTVKVVAGDEGALPGALVVLRTERSRFRLGTPTWSVPTRSALTGKDGTARLMRDERERLVVTASAPCFAHAMARGPRGTATTLRLQRGKGRELRVRSAESRPEAGVLVALGERPQPVGTTDESGAIEVRFGPGKPPALRLLAPDGRRLETRLDVEGAGGEKPQHLELPERLFVAGRMIDEESRRPITSGVVWDEGNPLEAATTDSSGGFALAGSAGDRLRITAGAPGYLLHSGFEFQLNDDGRAGPTLALAPAAAVEGKVTDAEGEPVAGAELDVRVRQNPGMMRIEIGRPSALPRAISDSRGAFRISPLDPAKSYDVRAEAEDFAGAEVPVSDLEPRRTTRGVSIELSRGRRVVGRVVDGDEHPLRGAVVELSPARAKGGMGMIRLMDSDSGEAAHAETTGEDGAFVLTGVPAGRFDLVAHRPGFARHKLSGIELKDETAGGLDLGDILLQPGESVEGIVRDEDGLPIEGVEVFVSESGPMMMMSMGPPGGAEPEADAITDPGGWFAVDDLAAGESYTLAFNRPGYVRKRAEGLTLPRHEPLEIAMDAASDVIGVVLDEQGEPIAGAQVTLRRSRTLEMGGMAMQTVMMEQATSESDGRFLFEDQEPGRASFSAVATGYQKADLDDVEIPKGADLEGLELPLTAGGIVQGRVLSPDGRPAIGASVRRVEEGGGMIPRFERGAMTDGNGYYRLEGLPPGELSVEATHDDYPRAVRDIEVREGINALDLEFEGGHEVAGRVSDNGGRPVPDAVVRLMPAGRYWGPEAETEADGTFSLPGVQDGDYRVWVESEGYAPSTDRNVKVDGQPLHGLEFMLESGGTVVGRITGLAPERFSEVDVRAEAPTFRGMGNSALVDFEGHYRLENLLPGTYDVVATLGDSGRRARGEAVIDSSESEVRVDLNFEAGLTLSGRATQGDAPVAGVAVYAEGDGVDHEGWGQTDLDGRFSIEGLVAGRYRIHLRDWQTGLAYEESIDLGTSREIELRVPTARVAGRIVDAADRQPLAGVTVTLTSQAGTSRGRLPVHTATTDLQGKFELASIADGSWRLAASKQGYAAEAQPVSVQHSRGSESLSIEMKATEGLTLEARLPTGAPATQLQVAVLDPSGAALVSGSYATGENGRVRLSSVPPGTWDLIVSAAGSATANLQASAPGAAVPLTLPAATRLRVRVPSLGESNTLATVHVRGADGVPFRTLGWNGQPRGEWRMSGGEIEFRSLPPGSWTVTVRADDRQWEGTTATSTAGAAELLLE